LAQRNDPGYHWKFHIQDHPQWLPRQEGNTLEEAEAVLNAARLELCRALTQNNAEAAFHAVRAIMDWGKVYYPQGPHGGNQEQVQGLFAAGTLLAYLRADIENLALGNYGRVYLLNNAWSGWTKVWAVYFNERFIMYDSRVGCAFCSMYADFVANGNGHIEGIRQIVEAGETKRYVPNIETARNPGQKSTAMAIASAVLQEVLRRAEGADPHPWFHGFSLRKLESRLFMLGADRDPWLGGG
jgi:hypothetical protein